MADKENVNGGGGHKLEKKQVVARQQPTLQVEDMEGRSVQE